ECYQRKESIIPQQALALANSELTLVQARRIARALHAATAGDDRAFVEAAFERVLSRPATRKELEFTLRFLDNQGRRLAAAKNQLAATAGSHGDFTKPAADVALRLRENVVHVLLNHNDFVTIR